MLLTSLIRGELRLTPRKLGGSSDGANVNDFGSRARYQVFSGDSRSKNESASYTGMNHPPKRVRNALDWRRALCEHQERLRQTHDDRAHVAAALRSLEQVSVSQSFGLVCLLLNDLLPSVDKSISFLEKEIEQIHLELQSALACLTLDDLADYEARSSEG